MDHKERPTNDELRTMGHTGTNYRQYALCHCDNQKLIDLFTLRRMGAAILESRDVAAIRWLQIVAPLPPLRFGEGIVCFFGRVSPQFFLLLVEVSSDI